MWFSSKHAYVWQGSGLCEKTLSLSDAISFRKLFSHFDIVLHNEVQKYISDNVTLSDSKQIANYTIVHKQQISLNQTKWNIFSTLIRLLYFPIKMFCFKDFMPVFCMIKEILCINLLTIVSKISLFINSTFQQSLSSN